MKRARHNKSRPEPAEREEGKPYGFVLVLRALASAAITIGSESPAALRVLCVLAEYVDQDGMCRVGQDTIAARLVVSRQAVNRQIQVLEANGLIFKAARKSGATLGYVIETDDFTNGREGEDRVEKRRAAKREAKRKAKVQHLGVAPEAAEVGQRVQHSDVAPVQPPEVAPGETSRGFTPCNTQTLHEETSSEISSRDFQKRAAGAPPSSLEGRTAPRLSEGSESGLPPTGDLGEARLQLATLLGAGSFVRGFPILKALGDGEQLVQALARDGLDEAAIFYLRALAKPPSAPDGCHVTHAKFGRGKLVSADGEKLTVNFDGAGQKMVLRSFVEVHQPTDASEFATVAAGDQF